MIKFPRNASVGVYHNYYEQKPNVLCEIVRFCIGYVNKVYVALKYRNRLCVNYFNNVTNSVYVLWIKIAIIADTKFMLWNQIFIDLFREIQSTLKNLKLSETQISMV